MNLTAGEQARVWAKGTKNLEAYLKVMEARESILRGNAVSVARGRQLAEEAIELDPRYAKAFSYIGTSHVAVTVFSACGMETEARKTAKELLRITPKFSAESFAAKLPYKDPKEKEPVVEALRKAGL